MMKLREYLKTQENLIVHTMCELISKKAISPESGGEGELERATYLQQVLESIGVDKIERYDTVDANNVIRPNIIAMVYGKDRSRTVWLVAHMDTVTEGDLSLWYTDPFKCVYKDGKIYGRGSEDNGQAIITGVFTIKAIRDLKLRLKYNLGLMLVADEELGSKYGIAHVLKHRNFSTNDLFYVPDSGSSDGSEIEVAEKSILWFKLKVYGKQAHASRPDQGLNANRISMMLNLEIDKVLHEKYKKLDTLFIPPISTFEPTKKEKNVDTINTIPGTDISYFDCRILPEYSVDDVLNTIHQIVKNYKDTYSTEITIEILQRSDATGTTSEDSEIVQLLVKALKEERNITAKVIGIGGGTCAAFFRARGYQTVVWSTIDELAHQPNEYCKLENIINDIQVFTKILTD